MKCTKCGEEYAENKIDDSHSVPCYLFDGDRKERKQSADKYPRHNICNEKCHKEYETIVVIELMKYLYDRVIEINDYSELMPKMRLIYRRCHLNPKIRLKAIDICLNISKEYFNDTAST